MFVCESELVLGGCFVLILFLPVFFESGFFRSLRFRQTLIKALEFYTLSYLFLSADFYSYVKLLMLDVIFYFVYIASSKNRGQVP